MSEMARKEHTGTPAATSGAFSPLRQHVVEEASAAKPKRRRRRGPSVEAREQKRFVRWARVAGLEVQHQNNGATTKARRMHLHAMGCTAGAADLIILDRLPKAPDARALGLEFKAPGGKQSDDQLAWKDRVVRLGWVYHVVWSAEDAKQVVQWYGLAPGV